jgi:acyl carrier protein
MNDQAVLDILQDYVGREILQDPKVIIKLDTPLLEWGVLNSISTMQLIGFIRERFQIDVPPEEVVGANFKDLLSISQLLLQLDGH